MALPSMNEALVRMEAHITSVSGALLARDALDLEPMAQALCEVVREFDSMVARHGPTLRDDMQFAIRLDALSINLAALREGLARRSAHVDRALSNMLPAAQSSGYAPARGVYGRPGVQTGAFRVLSA